MFEDIIGEERKDELGCWSCEYSTTAFFSLYCQKFNKYKTSFDGQKCKEFKERTTVCFGV
jgi:hypothetical protein